MPAEVILDTVNMDKAEEDAEVKKPHKAAKKLKATEAQKPHRKRKRKHFNSIRDQMEFYFGDANLSKDRFLKQLMDKDPFVPLEVFLTFNKLKTLTNCIDEIAKSLTNSQLLELDETQLKVRRKTALPPERNVDEKTLYVESLPPSADHEWVKAMFTQFGAVSYVSLPKYAKSRKIKEFAFVEFEQDESVAKAVKAFQEFKGVLSMQEADPAELKSVKAFIKEQQESVPMDEVANENATEKQQRKRRQPNTAAQSEEEQHDAVPKAKKPKTTEGIDATLTTATDDESAASTDADITTANEADAAETDDLQEAKKKRRKKKKKNKTLKETRVSDIMEHSSEATLYDLKILPKRDWKRLRNKYLNLQRERIAELKRKAWREAQQSRAAEFTDATADCTAPPVKRSKPTHERKLHKMHMNFYGAGDADVKVLTDKEPKQNAALERAPLFNYEPGLIVQLSFLEPCVTVKEFKGDMRQYAAVKYVDVKEGGLQAQLRLESATAATEFVQQISCAEYKCLLLNGEAETEYWRKIAQDREMKLNKKVKVPQKRGREKIKKLISKHMRFGDDDDE